jgi:uncharacterized protein
MAAQSGSSRVIIKLLRAGAKLDSQDMYGQTPLHLAAEDEEINILVLMLNKGADTRAKTRMGLTAHDVAKRNNRDKDIIQLLEPEGMPSA